MWTDVPVRRGAQRNSVWIGTAVGEEAEGRQGMDCEVGRRDASPFLRLYARRPAARKCRSADDTGYRGLPSDRPQVGKGSEVHRNAGGRRCGGAS